MFRARLALLVASSALLGLSVASAGESDAPPERWRPPETSSARTRVDNYVAALDARTGQTAWENPSFQITTATFELYADRLVVVTRTLGPDGLHEARAPVRPSSGKVMPPAAGDLGGVVAMSDTWRPTTIRFDNGWWVKGFDAGYDKAIRLADADGEPVWALQTDYFPEKVGAWNNVLLWDEGRHPSSGRLHAHLIGAARELWQADFERASGQARVDAFRVLGDSLYVQSGALVCEVDPSSGEIRHQWDLASLARPGSGAVTRRLSGSARFSRDAHTLVIALESHLFGIDRESHTLLWSRPTHAAPSPQYALAHAGRVYFLAGRPPAGPGNGAPAAALPTRRATLASAAD